MTDQDPIHTDCGFEVGDSGDSHLPARDEFPEPRPFTAEEQSAMAEWIMEPDALRAAEESEPATLPEIVRDVQQAGHCAECDRSLADQTTHHVHKGNRYCTACFDVGVEN